MAAAAEPLPLSLPWGVICVCAVTTGSCLLLLTGKAPGCNLSDQMQLSVGLHLQTRQISSPNAHLQQGYSPSLCPQWKISTFWVQFVSSESRGLSRSDVSHARSTYFCPQGEEERGVPRAAVGTSSVQSQASSIGAPQYPSRLPGTPTLEPHGDLLLGQCSFPSCEHPYEGQVRTAI